jgi:hypothetical protein
MTRAPYPHHTPDHQDKRLCRTSERKLTWLKHRNAISTCYHIQIRTDVKPDSGTHKCIEYYPSSLQENARLQREPVPYRTLRHETRGLLNIGYDVHEKSWEGNGLSASIESQDGNIKGNRHSQMHERNICICSGGCSWSVQVHMART